MHRFIRFAAVSVVSGLLIAAAPPGGQEGHGDAHAGDAAHHDAGMESAAKLAVHAPPSWYSKVVTGSIVLFVLAATLGSVAVLTKAPEPQEPDHHDDHGHGGHGGHGHH